MTTLRSILATLRAHLPAYLRNDHPTQDQRAKKDQQKVASSTVHG